MHNLRMGCGIEARHEVRFAEFLKKRGDRNSAHGSSRRVKGDN